MHHVNENCLCITLKATVPSAKAETRHTVHDTVDDM